MPLSKLKVSLGERIEVIRIARNLTQKDMAGLCDCDVRTIQRIENGEKFPTPTLLTKILKALRIPSDYLILVATDTIQLANQ
jgi:transcriptional regulator with XRE-family HTH domain